MGRRAFSGLFWRGLRGFWRGFCTHPPPPSARLFLLLFYSFSLFSSLLSSSLPFPYNDTLFLPRSLLSFLSSSFFSPPAFPVSVTLPRRSLAFFISAFFSAFPASHRRARLPIIRSLCFLSAVMLFLFPHFWLPLGVRYALSSLFPFRCFSFYFRFYFCFFSAFPASHRRGSCQLPLTVLGNF